MLHPGAQVGGVPPEVADNVPQEAESTGQGVMPARAWEDTPVAGQVSRADHVTWCSDSPSSPLRAWRKMRSQPTPNYLWIDVTPPAALRGEHQGRGDAHSATERVSAVQRGEAGKVDLVGPSHLGKAIRRRAERREQDLAVEPVPLLSARRHGTAAYGKAQTPPRTHTNQAVQSHLAQIRRSARHERTSAAGWAEAAAAFLPTSQGLPVHGPPFAQRPWIHPCHRSRRPITSATPPACRPIMCR